MATVSPAGALAACALAAAVACGGVAMVSQTAGVTVFHAPAAPTAPVLSFADAARLAGQAGFGPTVASVNHMVGMTADAWLDEQFADTSSTYADLTSHTTVRDHCKLLTGTDATVCNLYYFSDLPVQMRFYADAVGNSDQLRQRVAFALSQLIVTSGSAINQTAGAAAFHQILLTNAFGNYRDILKAVTLSPYMGSYLNLAGSSKTAPNENYAREMMQLFALGVAQLNPDGTPILDANGVALPTYASTDVHDVARALTGWTYATLADPANTDTSPDFSKPMVAAPKNYDTTAKTFLGRTVPAGASQDASVDAVVDTVFNHPNVGPYVSRALIQQLVVSNPSAAYVGRISKVFADNGSGVRGDMKAVVRAILTDAEARDAGRSPATQGKVKEPVLMMTTLARAIGMTTDGYAFTTRDSAMGQKPFNAPSVFNFYPPDYPLPLSNGLLSPPSKLMTTATILARHNLAYDWTVAGDPAGRAEYKAQVNIAGATGTQPDWTAWQGLDVDTQLDRAAALLVGGGLSAPQRAAVRAAMTAVVNADPATQARRRAQTALYLIASSPLFQIDR